jgi:hypothetical protein
VTISPPGEKVNDVPDSMRRMCVFIDSGSGTYCRIR